MPSQIILDGETSPEGMKIWAIAPNTSDVSVASYKHWKKSVSTVTGEGRGNVITEVEDDKRNLVAAAALGGLFIFSNEGTEWGEGIEASGGSILAYYTHEG